MIELSEDKTILDMILLHVCSIEDILALLLLEKHETLVSQGIASFGTSKKRAEVYLILDGKLSATEIGRKLRMKRPNVSIEIKNLLDCGLIELSNGAGSPYRRRKCYELIGLPEKVASEFKL